MTAIYRLRALSDENDNFVREWEVPGEIPLTRLHEMISTDLKFGEGVLASFFAASPMWEKLREYTLADMGEGVGEVPFRPMEGATLAGLVAAPRERFIYMFDPVGERALFVELAEVGTPEPGAEYPRLALSRGPAPENSDAFGEGNEGSIFDDAMSEFSDFQGDDSWDGE